MAETASKTIRLKTPREFEIMRKAGKIVAKLWKEIEQEVKPGVTTAKLDAIAEDFIRSHGAEPAFKGYYGFTGTICASVNDEVVHGIPGKRVLEEGDIIGIDTGTKLQGYYSDSARTFAVGRINATKRKLIDAARESLDKGIAEAVIGRRIGDISCAVQKCVEGHGFDVVRQYVGHGIGTQLHEEPQVPNFGKSGIGPAIEVGMALAIEPMVNAGSHKVFLCEDGWTVRTTDGKPSSHFEDTILVTENGTEIATRDA